MNPTIKGFIKKELSQTLRDVRMRILLFVMPVIQLSIFGLALSMEVKNIRLGFMAAPNDGLAWRLNEHALASGWFIPAKNQVRDPAQALLDGSADAVFISPPEGLSKAVRRGEGQLQLLVNGTNAIRARAIENYFSSVMQKTAAEWSGAAGREEALRFDIRVLYNPSMKTALFLVPGVMVMILCLLTIILPSMAMAREKELGTFETLISAPLRNWEILLGKTLPYFILGLIDVPLIIGAGTLLFGVPVRGHLWQILLSASLFIATTVSVGILISTIAKNQQQAMLGSFIFLFPAIQLSGIMFPLENMPVGLQYITYLNPLRFFVNSLRNIMLKGGDPTVVWQNMLGMGILAAIAVWATFKRFQQTLN